MNIEKKDVSLLTKRQVIKIVTVFNECHIVELCLLTFVSTSKFWLKSENNDGRTT